MSRMKEALMDIEELVVEAVYTGANTVIDVQEYVNRNSIVKADKELVISIMDYLEGPDHPQFNRITF